MDHLCSGRIFCRAGRWPDGLGRNLQTFCANHFRPSIEGSGRRTFWWRPDPVDRLRVRSSCWGREKNWHHLKFKNIFPQFMFRLKEKKKTKKNGEKKRGRSLTFAPVLLARNCLYPPLELCALRSKFCLLLLLSSPFFFLLLRLLIQGTEIAQQVPNVEKSQFFSTVGERKKSSTDPVV